MSYFRTQLEDWLKTLEIKADKVLDVGGGALPVPQRVKSWDVQKYKILDNKLEKMKWEPDIVCDLNEPFTGGVLTGLKEYSEYFDTVFCLEVFEYVFEPLSVLRRISLFMKKGGTMYISFPFIYPHHNPEGKDYLRYTRWGVEKLLKEAGFKIDYIQSRVENDNLMLDVFYTKEGMHPCKEYRGHNEIGYLVKVIKI